MIKAMKKTRFVALHLLVLAFLAGCAGMAAGPDVAGLYQLDKEALKAVMMKSMPADMPTEGPQAEAAQKMMDQMIGGMKATMDLRADQTCLLSMSMMGQEKKVAGSWKLDQGRVAITAKEDDGKEETRYADFDNGTLTLEEESGGKKMEMKFTRLPKQ